VILIADASALVALSACDSLPLLDAIFGAVWVPEAVFLEVTRSGKPHAEALRSYLSEKIHPVDLSQFVFLDAQSDLGETAE
jgi:uncharacterized protein